MTIRVLASVIEGDPQGLEHEMLAWEEEEVLPSYDLAPSDRRYVEARLEKQRDRRPGNRDPDHA